MNEPRYTALTEDELKDQLQAVMTERDELRARVNELSVHVEMCADVDAAHCIEIVEQGEQIMALLEALEIAPELADCALSDATEGSIGGKGMNVHLMYSPEGYWVGIYFNGKLRAQGHSFSAREALGLLDGYGISLTTSEMPEGAAKCPATLEEKA